MGAAPKTPDVVHPGEAAQAAMGTAGAGEAMSVANQPIEQYANLATTRALGPAEMQAQQAIANQAAYQGAQAQQDIQSRVDPMAYAQRQMRMQAANRRLGQLYNVDPTAYTYRAPNAYAMPTASSTPSLADLQKLGAAAASNLSMGSVDRSGGNPQLIDPSNPQAMPVIKQPTYLT
jgi:hypothetical protein